MPENEIAVVEPAGDIAKPKNYGDLMKLAETVTSTDLCPAAYKRKPKEAAVAMMMAVEAGANPVTALNFIAVINNRPAWYADAVPGVAKAKGLITGYKEWYEGEEGTDAYKAICEVFTPDGLTYRNEFSVKDAKTANLWGKAGPWKNYPKRMMKWRARSWSIRDAAPDAFFGPTAEEMQDVNSQHRGPDRAKPINVDTSAPKRKIVTMTTTEVEAAADAQVAENPPKEEQAKVSDQPKPSLKTIIMMLADTDSLEDVNGIEAMLAEKRDGMKEGHITALERAIAEARSRLMTTQSNADAYAERIMAGIDLDAVKSEIEADDELSPGDRNTLLTMIADHQEIPAE